MSDDRAALTDAVANLLGALMGALEGLDWAQRHLHPPAVDRLAEQLAPLTGPLASSLAEVRGIGWPEHLREDGGRLERAGEIVGEALAGFVEAPAGVGLGDGAGVLPRYRALRRRLDAWVELYPLHRVLVPVSRFFLEESVRGSADLLARLAAPPARQPECPVGVLLGSGAERGGFSLYVPEYWTPSREWPLVVALHGGSGRGSGFLWSWVREARSRGVVVLAPTSRGDTWSLLAPPIDAEAVAAQVEELVGAYRLDRSRILLTGMSDGGTFTLQAGSAPGAPYTHLAPISGVLAPLDTGSRERLRGRPVYLVHGALDWMFPVPIARLARDELERFGAAVRYRELPDLSHTYPREENAAILDWFAPDHPPGRIALELAP